MKPFMLMRFSLGAILAGLSVCASVAAEVPVLRLHPNAFVGSQGVFLHLLVDSNQPLPSLRLCDSPAFGQSLLLSRARILELANAAGFDGISTNWDGAGAVRISRRSRKLAESELVQMLTSLLQEQSVKERGELELHFSRPWVAIPVPDEELKIKIAEQPIQGVSQSFLVRFELQTTKGEDIGSWQAALLAHIWREVWVARSALTRGSPVRERDLTRERRDILTCREAPAQFDPDHADLEINEPVAAGVPLLARCIKVKPAIRRGQSVAAVLEDGALAISLKVEALEDGVPGQVIRIRNPLSRRDLRGKVIDERKIQVCL